MRMKGASSVVVKFPAIVSLKTHNGMLELSKHQGMKSD
jgi:hypothetical protein